MQPQTKENAAGTFRNNNYIVFVAEGVDFRYRERVVYRIAACGSYGMLKR
jgi:hypothetical protein